MFAMMMRHHARSFSRAWYPLDVLCRIQRTDAAVDVIDDKLSHILSSSLLRTLVSESISLFYLRAPDLLRFSTWWSFQGSSCRTRKRVPRTCIVERPTVSVACCGWTSETQRLKSFAYDNLGRRNKPFTPRTCIVEPC